MKQAIFLGFIQGVTEWLPVSSEGALVLAQTIFFGKQAFKTMVYQALFLHLGSFLAALLYFRREVVLLIKTFFGYSSAKKETQKMLHFLGLSTMISGLLGFFLLTTVSHLEAQLQLTGKAITFGIGLLLLVTASWQIKAKETGVKAAKDLLWPDSLFLGILQGLAVLPGLSRSGLTVSGLLLRKFDKTLALKLSFLMSLPIVLAGNIFLNLPGIVLTPVDFLSLATAFISGLLTIHLLLNLARKINFGYFVFIFGFLTMMAALV